MDMVISWLPNGLSSGDLSLDRDAIPKVGFKTVKINPTPFPRANPYFS